MRTRSKGRTRRGFTLVELMVVVIIIGVVCAAVVPNLGGSIASRRIDAATRQIADLLDYAYNAAITTERVYGLIFSEDGRRFDLVALRPPAEGGDDAAALGEEAEPQFDSVQWPGFVERDLPEGVAMKEAAAYDESLLHGRNGETRLLFFPDGTTEFATLTLEDASGARRAIEVNGLSGAVRVYNPAAEEPEPAVREVETTGLPQ